MIKDITVIVYVAIRWVSDFFHLHQSFLIVVEVDTNNISFILVEYGFDLDDHLRWVQGGFFREVISTCLACLTIIDSESNCPKTFPLHYYDLHFLMFRFLSCVRLLAASDVISETETEP